MAGTTRTQDEILARFKEAQADENDIFNHRIEVLMQAMDLDTIIKAVPDPSLKMEGKAEDYPVVKPDEMDEKALSYFTFAVEKALTHRGLSAGRSVTKMTEYMWLLGQDDVVKAIEEASYSQYGVPKLLVISHAMNYPISLDSHEAEMLNRMGSGLPCIAGCDEGCGK